MRFAGTQISNFMDNDSFDNISKTAAKSRSQERMAYDQSEGLVDRADINAEATIQAAKYGASATRAQGAASGQMGIASGIGNLASGIAGGLINKATPDPKPAPRPNTTPLQGASYLQPTAPTSLPNYQLLLDEW